MSENGVLGYSGGASGMDTAFMEYYNPNMRKIFIPDTVFYDHRHNGKDVIALRYLNPNDVLTGIEEVKAVCLWEDLSLKVKKLFTRNAAQVLGERFCEPVDLVLYGASTSNGYVKGGTRIAVKIAERHGIPCVNIYDPLIFRALKSIVNPDLRDLGIL